MESHKTYFSSLFAFAVSAFVLCFISLGALKGLGVLSSLFISADAGALASVEDVDHAGMLADA